jgi:taurine dioxygenase
VKRATGGLRGCSAPTVFPVSKHFGGVEFLHVIEDTEESPPDADGWHMDITWIDEPPKLAILAALVIPSYGGDTIWTDLYGAWNQLSPVMKTILAPLQVHHAPGEAFWEALNRASALDVAELRRVFPGQCTRSYVHTLSPAARY